jgi:iron(III) transport system ATP-binding protein
MQPAQQTLTKLGVSQATQPQPVIELRGVAKRFGTQVQALQDISFALMRGTLLVLLGPSGCGKTTALRIIAGLENPDAGEIILNGERVAVAHSRFSLAPEKRHIGMVFQDYALFPHLSVADNVAFPISRMPAELRRKRVQEMLDLVGLADFETRFPHQLSGGQQQRVALARALAAQPAVVLFDEPFSNLDAALRHAMRDQLRRILRNANATAIFVTHDQEEALSLADCVAVMSRGRILQLGSPHEVYLRPASREVAAFVGDMNLVRATAHNQVADCAFGKVLLSEPANGAVDVMIRPESIRLVPNANAVACVEHITFYGHDQVARVRVGDNLALLARMFPRPDIAEGVRVSVVVQGAAVAFPV